MFKAMDVMKGKQKFLLILILGLLSAIGPFSIDMYLPGFPAIAKDLKTDVATVSLSLSSFFIGISAGQLIYGPLLDRFGRKKPLFAGLVIYIVASLGCVFANSVHLLIGLRLFQALGGCSGMVAARALVRDIFPVEENAKVFALLMLVIGVSPIIAPTLGGYITTALGWHYIFILLALMGCGILTAAWFIMPDGRAADITLSLKPAPILSNFYTVLKEPQFLTYSLTGAAASAGLYAYIAGSPYVFMELYKVSERGYGWIFATIAGGLITCSQLNSLLLRTYRSEQIIRVAAFCQSMTGLVLFVATILNMLNVYGTIALIFVFLCCQGFIFPNSSALSLAPFTKNAGSASALLGSIQLGIGTLSSAMVSVLNDHTALPMAEVMAISTLTAFIVLISGNRVIVRRKVI
ncbi:MAG TPA: multidrug effflux MFS transporter [Panacibacter sp.]|nr:multidrug effflux MFS transporter [Panacibacter sp.]HNP46047.1 multidrug effflux MFS transporter [Panacibacter sp.]